MVRTSPTASPFSLVTTFKQIFRGIFGAAKFLMRMLSIISRSAFPSKHAEHTHQGLMRNLSIRVRNWCACWAYASGTDAHAEHTLQFLTRMLSIRVKTQILKGPSYHAEHTRQGLMCVLSMCIRNWCACWAYASAPSAYAQLAHQKLNEAWLPQKLK